MKCLGMLDVRGRSASGAIGAIGALVLAACSTSSSGNAGSEAGGSEAGGSESGAGDGGDDGSLCGTTLCIHGDQPPQCPSCSPSAGDICSPPAAVTCDYTNGCSGALEEASHCTCVLPDAGADDGGDGGDAGTSNDKAYWSCTLGV